MSDIVRYESVNVINDTEGIRRLLVISGDAAWCRERASDTLHCAR